MTSDMMPGGFFGVAVCVAAMFFGMRWLPGMWQPWSVFFRGAAISVGISLFVLVAFSIALWVVVKVSPP
jgi:hypothetical protein